MEHVKPHDLPSRGGVDINDNGFVSCVKATYRSGGRRKVKKQKAICNGTYRVVGTAVLGNTNLTRAPTASGDMM